MGIRLKQAALLRIVVRLKANAGTYNNLAVGPDNVVHQQIHVVWVVQIALRMPALALCRHFGNGQHLFNIKN